MLRGLVVVVAGCGRLAFEPGQPVATDDASTLPADGPDPAPLTITRLLLYSATTDLILSEIPASGPIDITSEPGGVGVVAEVAGAASVKFVCNGRADVENVPPWASGGDDGNGGLSSDVSLKVGVNTVEVVAFEQAGLGGASGPSVSVSFELALPLTPPWTVTGFNLINNAGGVALMPLTDGMQISIASLPPEVDISAVTSPSFVGSVGFTGSGPWMGRTENWAPYTAMGRSQGLVPQVGTYTVTAVAYPRGDQQGTPGPTSSVSFELVP